VQPTIVPVASRTTSLCMRPSLSAAIQASITLGTEVSIQAASDYHTWPRLRLGRDVALLGLMMGERMESLRASMVRRMLPGLGGLSAVHPLLMPFATYRSMLARGLAPIEVNKTYRSTATTSSH